MTKARYLYCIARKNGREVNLGKGVQGEEVRIIQVSDLIAAIHDCEPEPYETKKEAKAKQWVKQHQSIIEEVEDKFGTVIPFGFDMIFKNEENLLGFLEKNEKKIKSKLKKLRGKEEFGVRIFYKESWEKDMKREMKRNLGDSGNNLSKGKKYFAQKGQEKKVKKGLREKLKDRYKEFYRKIKEPSSDLVAEDAEEERELARFSCLLSTDKIQELSSVLDDIKETEGFKVRFTGPWPPYSFVKDLVGEENGT